MQRSVAVRPAEAGSDGDRTGRFEAIFAAHSATIYAYARRRAARDEAEDIVSEVFLVAWRRLDQVPAEPVPWLIGVARKVLANRRRGDARRAALDHRVHQDVAIDRDHSTHDPRVGIVLAALANLPPGEREVIELVAWEELSPAEAAAALGIARATVYVRLHRARQRLAGLLEDTQ